MRAFKSKLFVIVTLCILGTIATGSMALAESVEEIEARLSTARASDQIDQATYADLKAILDEARTATNSTDYNSSAEAYNLLVPGFLSASFDPYGS